MENEQNIFNNPEENSSLNEQFMVESGLRPETEQTGSVNSSSFKLTVEPLIFTLFITEALSDSLTANFILARSCEVHFQFNKSVCDLLESDDANRSEVESIVQPYSSVILTGMTYSSIFLPALVSLFLGSWSDRNGRRVVIYIPAAGFVLKYILMAIFCYIPTLPPTFGLVAVLPMALCGGVITPLSAAFSYISDITNEENRSVRISVLEGAIYCGSIIGYAVTYLLLHTVKTYIFSFIFCAGALLLVLVPTYYFLPESVQRTEDGRGIWHMFELKLIKEIFSVCFKKRENYKRAVIFLVITSLSISISAGTGESYVKYYFTRLRFNWKILEYTTLAAVSIFISFTGIMVGTFVLIKWLKVGDAMLGVIGFEMEAGGALYCALIPSSSSYLLYYVGFVKFFGGLCGPAGRSLLSKTVPKEDLGKLFALLGSSESLLPLVITPFYTWIYSWTLKTFPGAFFLLSVGLYLLNILIFTIINFIERREEILLCNKMKNENDGELQEQRQKIAAADELAEA